MQIIMANKISQRQNNQPDTKKEVRGFCQSGVGWGLYPFPPEYLPAGEPDGVKSKGMRKCHLHDFKVNNPPVPAAAPPPAAEAIALLAAPELPPPPRALRGACMRTFKIYQNYWQFKEFNLGSNCSCSAAITFGTNHVGSGLWKRKLWPHLSGTNRYKRQVWVFRICYM